MSLLLTRGYIFRYYKNAEKSGGGVRLFFVQNNEKKKEDVKNILTKKNNLIRLKKLQSNKENRDGYSYEPGYIYVIWRNDNRKSDGNYFREHG